MQTTKDIFQFSTLKDGEILTVDFSTVKKTLPFNGSFPEMEDGFYEKGNAAPEIAACSIVDDDIRELQGYGNPSTIITSFGTNRQPGNSSLTKEQIISHKKVCFWTLEMRCIVKPIETFLFADEKKKLTSRDKKKKWLAARAAMLKSWENLKSMRFIKPWLDLCYITCGDMEDDYDDGKKEWREKHPYSKPIPVTVQNSDGTTTQKTQQCYYLTRWARAIACKKMRGITTYNYYYPVISCTRMSDEPFEDVKSDGIGKNELGHVIDTLYSADAYGWSPYSSTTPMVQTILNLLGSYKGDDALALIKIADKVSRNGDGSYRRNEQWCAINYEDWHEYCTDLYPIKGDVLI